MANEMDYLISMKVELERGKEEINKIYKLLKDTFSKPIRVQVNAQANFSQAVSEVGRLDKAIKQVGESTDRAQNEMRELEKKATETAGKLNASLGGSAEALTKAFALGRKNAESEVARMVTNMQQQVMSAASRHRRSTQVGLAERAVKAAAGLGDGVDRVIRNEMRELQDEKRELLEQQKDLFMLYKEAKATYDKIRQENTNPTTGKTRVNADLHNAQAELGNVMKRAEQVKRGIDAIDRSLLKIKQHVGDTLFGDMEAEFTGAATAEKKLEQALDRLDARMARLRARVEKQPTGARAGINAAALTRMSGERDFLMGILEEVKAGTPGALERASGSISDIRGRITNPLSQGAVNQFRVHAMNYVSNMARRQARSPYLDLRSQIMSDMQANNTPIAASFVAPPHLIAQQMAGVSGVTTKIDVDENHLLNQIIIAMDKAEQLPLRFKVDEAYLQSQIKAALDALSASGLKIRVGAIIEDTSQRQVGETIAAAINQGVGKIVNDTFKAVKHSSVTRSERDAMRAQVLQDPLTLLSSLGMSAGGLDHAKVIKAMFDAGDKATPDQILAAMGARGGFLGELSKLTGPKSAVASSMFGAEWMSRLKEVEDSHFARTLNRNVRTMPSDVWQQQVINPHIASMRALSGERPDFTHNIDRDYYTEQLRAYKDVLSQVRRLEEESVRFFRAKNSPEALEASRRRVNAIREELEVQEQHYRMMALQGSGDMLAKSFQFREGMFTEGAASYQNKADVFRNTNQLFRSQYGGAYQGYLARVDQIRSGYINRGDADGAAGVGELSFDQFLNGLASGNTRLQSILLKSMGVEKEILKDEQQRVAILNNMLAPLRSQLTYYNQIGAEITKQTAEMRVIEKFEILKAQRARNPMGYARAVRGASYAFGGVAVGMAAGFAMRSAFQNFRQLEQEFADIRGVLNASVADIQMLQAGVFQTAQRYGADLMQTAQAAKVLAQAGYEANEVVRELDATMLGMRGLGMTIEQMQELQVAIRALSGPGHTLDVLSKISKVEAEYAVTAQDLADVIRIASPVMNQYATEVQGIGDAYDFTIGMATVMIEKLRMTGVEAGNALKFMMARIVQPDIQKHLQQDFGLKLGASPKEFLQLPDLIGSIHDRWRALQQDNPAQATAFLVQLAGGRRVNALISMLESYEKMQEISTKSMSAFGDVERRTVVATDTLNVSLNRLRTNFQLFVGNMAESTQLAAGLKVAVDALAISFAGISGQGMGTLGTLGLVAGGGLAVRGMQRGYRWLEAASILGPEAGLYMDAVKNRRARQMRAVAGTLGDAAQVGTLAKVTGLFGKMAKIFTPGGALLLGLLAFVGVIGAAAKAVEFFFGKDKQDLVRLRSLQELKVYDAPQMKEYKEISKRYGFGSTREAFDATAGAITGQGFNNIIAQINAGGEGLRNEAMREFIDGLGTAGDRIKQLKSESEQVAEAMRLLGYASWSANAQILDGLEQISNTSQTIIDEALEGVDVIDRSQRRGLGKVAHWFGDMFKGRGSWQKDIHLDFGSFSAKERLLGVLKGTDMDASLFKAFNSTEFSNAVLDAANDFKDKVVDASELFAHAITKLSPENYKAMVERGAQAVLKKINGGVFEAATNATDLESDPDTVKRSREFISKLFQDIRERVEQLAGQGLDAQNPQAARLRELYAKLADPKQMDRFALQLADATEGLGRFKNALLDMIIGFIQQMKQMELENTYAARYGDTYDNVGAVRQLSKDMFIKSNMIQIESLADVFRARMQYEMGASVLSEMGLDETAFIKGSLSQTDAQSAEKALGSRGKGALQTYENLRTAYAEAFNARSTVAELFGNSAEGQQLVAMFESLLAKILGGTVTKADWQTVFNEASDTMRRRIDAESMQRTMQTTMLTARGQDVGAYASLAEKQLSVETNITSQFAKREQLRVMEIAQKRDELQLQWEQRAVTDEAYVAGMKSLQLEYLRGQALSVQTAQLETQNAFILQGRENMANSLQGFRDMAKTMDVVNMKGRDIFRMGVGPAIETMYGRMVDNMFDQLLQLGAQNEGISKIFQGPEFMMRQAITDSSTFGAARFHEAIISASVIAAQNLAAGIAGGSIGSNIAWGGLKGYNTKKGQGGGNLSGSGRAAMLQSLASMAGAMGGAALGGGGQMAGMGSMVGSMLPLLLSIGGPAGIALGLLGGIGGGLLGGLFDKKDRNKPEAVISQLEAIERAQKETVEAIEAQTDALLRPENRFLNMPTNFTVPGYNPGAVSVGNVSITVNANGLSAEEAQRVVEDAISNTLYGGRRNRARGSGRV